ncbi:MAG TPA: helix-turn-helix transcriptional regulator [Solirubrobacteraceae bacterium]|jgi:RNase adaptor protein for sRNA GlmZ degradation|nr:helix-turn-helix transcriptional regulator [Solirubrobacteraceae bacterium]
MAVARNARHSKDEPDALDEMIVEFTDANPDFPQLLLAAERRRALLRTLAEQRRRRDLSQTRVAAAMRTSQPTLARLETTAADAKLSTVERFAGALGYAIEYHLVPAAKSERRQGIVVESE